MDDEREDNQEKDDKVTKISTEVLIQGPHKLSFDDRKDELRLLNTARHLASEKRTSRIPAAAGRRGTFELFKQKQNRGVELPLATPTLSQPESVRIPFIVK